MRLLFLFLKHSGIPLLVRELFQRRRVTILLYHNLSYKNASSHFRFLKKHYSIIPLKQLIDAHRRGALHSLPKKALVITFDDGHKNNYSLLPLLITLNIPITIFLCSHIVGTNRRYWFDHIKDRLNIRTLNRIKNAERIILLKRHGFSQYDEFAERVALSVTEINEMKKHVDFQSHTMFHSCLPSCTDSEAEEEIVNSKKHLEHIIGQNISVLSYPNGDYCLRDINLVKRAGYEAAITCDLWFNKQNTSLYKLKRIDCRDDASLAELEVKVSGIYPFLKRLILGSKFGYREIY